MTGVLRIPLLAFALVVERLRRLPGARFVAPLLPWISRALLVGAVVLVLLWMAEASPQRISLAQLAAGNLSHMQSWVIVDGELTEEANSAPGGRRYALTDPAAPNARLDVRSTTDWTTGRTTVSGRVLGGTDGVPEGYEWAALLTADDRLADELPPPWTAALLAGLALVIVLARRTTYPAFVAARPAGVPPAFGNIRVAVRREEPGVAAPPVQATLDLRPDLGAAGELRVPGAQPIPIRLSSAHTSVDVGVLLGVRWSEPVIRVRAPAEDLTISFASAQQRDASYAALAAHADRQLGRRRAAPSVSLGEQRP